MDYSNAEEQFNRFRSISLPAMTWPDLPPEVLEESNGHEVAYSLRHSRVLFPLHHSIGDRDLYSMGPELGQCFEPLHANVDWECSTRTGWSEYLRQAGRSNLLQSWEYGEAKQSTENWRIKRGVFSIDGQEVAIVQVLVKRLLGFVKIYRINTGPLFLRNPDQATVSAVYNTLRTEMTGLLKGRLLIHLPALVLDGNSITLLSGLGYRLTSPGGWESVWVDLSKSQDDLRKMLDGKWRNKLSIAERHGVRFEACTDSDSFEWILTQCSKMMTSRNAGKIPTELYRVLNKRLDETSNPIIVFKAFSGKDLLAGICIVPHGSAATYLLGWNGDEGRQLKANQFLLWNAISYLKDQGIDWFDLGGIDEEGVLGITKFKLGLNGERYELVGDYWL